ATAVILDLETESAATSLLSSDPNLFKLSKLLTDLKTLHRDLEKLSGYSLKSILRRRITAYRIYQLGSKIEAEIQVYFDREQIQKLARTLQLTEEEEEKFRLLEEFVERLGKRFDSEFQESILKAKLFSILESQLCELSDRWPTTRVKERVARDIVGLVRFNKDVLVDLVLMGPTVHRKSSPSSIDVGFAMNRRRSRRKRDYTYWTEKKI
ncbi:unnamed protein product, partial [Linum tenue]